MATLVLSTVGTMLGGPVGGAIGSLLGQSIDQQILGAGERRGPRLGDLSVQTSSYGSQVPQIFGTMRVAGAIVWSTDLIETSVTQGAKGQPETVTYSYSASFAVALSSRPIERIGRIWADGKLIRTAEGEFSVGTEFRVQKGSEDQDVDPLIASVEGVGSTPAYRGLALAIFENLQLAEFGNRIPFLTLEVVADADAVPIAGILNEVSEGSILAAATSAVSGYAAHGSTISAAVEPLIDAFGMQLFDDGTTLSTPSTQAVVIDEDETGCSADQKGAPRYERSQAPLSTMPSALTLAYYDRGRDFQSGLARASIERMTEKVERLELPAVLESSAAKGLAETCIGRRWAERDRLTLRLPPSYLSLAAGALVRPPTASGTWIAERVTLESLAAIAELRPAYDSIDAIPADAGRVLASSATLPSPTKLLVVELPDDGTGTANSPVVVVAAAGSTPWRPVPVQVEAGGTQFTMRTAAAPAVIGSTLTALGPGEAALFDLRNSVEVQLASVDDWLESRDDDSLLAGENLAILGDELIQFGDAVALGGRRFRLSRLLRGRRGTEWAMGVHRAGDAFVLLDRARVQRLPLTPAQVGGSVRVTPCGLADEESETVEHLVRGDAMRPPSPVHLQASLDQSGNLNCSWVRRSSSGWDWIDGVDAPLGCAEERYRIALRSSTAEIAVETNAAVAQFTASDIAALNDSELELTVAQVGDFGISKPAILPVTTIS